jgi:hypothetical protein
MKRLNLERYIKQKMSLLRKDRYEFLLRQYPELKKFVNNDKV